MTVWHALRLSLTGGGAGQQATAYKQAGFDDAAKAVLTKYGLDETMLDTWQGMSSVQQDQMAALLQGASLAGSGNDTAAKNYLQMAGVDTGSIDYSPTLNQRQLNYTANQLALNNRYRTTGSGSRRTGARRAETQALAAARRERPALPTASCRRWQQNSPE